MLCVIETHPVQYHAPVYRAVQQELGVPVTAVYGSDFSVKGYVDREFRARFAWDVDLLSGYRHEFLSTEERGAPQGTTTVRPRQLRQALARVKPAAIMLLGYSPRFHQIAFFEARHLGCPLMFRAETTDHAQSRGILKAWVRDRGLAWLYRSCGRLLYVGEHSRRHFQRLGCESEKLVFSPYCVDTAHFQLGESERETLRARTRAELSISHQQRVLLFSGKLSERKGVDLLLQAIKALPAPLRGSVVLLLLGAGDLMQTLHAGASTEPRIELRSVGFQNQSQLSRFYHAADLLILPSVQSETWGLVVNEALHHGVPCVVSDAVGCAPDLIVSGRTGEVCDAGSVTALGSAIQRALDWAGRADVRQGCQAQVAKYSVSRAAQGVARAYQDLTKPLNSAH